MVLGIVLARDEGGRPQFSKRKGKGDRQILTGGGRNNRLISNGNGRRSR